LAEANTNLPIHLADFPLEKKNIGISRVIVVEVRTSVKVRQKTSTQDSNWLSISNFYKVLLVFQFSSIS